MPELSPIDPRSVALLVMDYQVDTLTRFMTPAQSADARPCVPDLLAAAMGDIPVLKSVHYVRSIIVPKRPTSPIARGGAHRYVFEDDLM